MVSAASLSLPVWTAGVWRDERAAHGQRLRSAIGVVLVHGLIGYALVAGLGYRPVVVIDERLKVFDVAPEPPPPPPPTEEAPAPQARAERAEGAAAPPNLEARPKPFVVPPPRIRLEIAEQLGAAPIAGAGPDLSAGAAATPGDGTGAGGAGTGTGAGRAGSGTGGSGGGIAIPARHVRGRIDEDDYPRSAYRERAGGSVTARLTVGMDGRVTRCTVTRSSGHAGIDATTCGLIERRFRYEPARDRNGRPVASDVGWRQTWWLEPR